VIVAFASIMLTVWFVAGIMHLDTWLAWYRWLDSVDSWDCSGLHHTEISLCVTLRLKNPCWIRTRSAYAANLLLLSEPTYGLLD